MKNPIESFQGGFAPEIIEALADLLRWGHLSHDCARLDCEDGCPVQVARAAIAKEDGRG